MPKRIFLTFIFLFSALIFLLPLRASYIGASALFFYMAELTSILLFICFGMICIVCGINRKISPFMVFAVTDGIIFLTVLLCRSEFFVIMRILTVPITFISLIIDLILWRKYVSSPKIPDLYKQSENMKNKEE